MTPPLPDVLLYTRAGCHLCDETRSILHALLSERAAQGRPAPHLREIDITADRDLERAFLTTIPVVEVGRLRLELATSAARIRSLLAQALDRPVDETADGLAASPR